MDSSLSLIAQLCSVLLLFIIFSLNTTMAAYNIVDYGANPDGQTDSTRALLRAWTAACSDDQPATMYVPPGQFLIQRALLLGPCKSNATRVVIDGTLVAPSGYSSATYWIMFKYVRGLSVFGCTIDGRGQSLWDCKNADRRCPQGATSLSFNEDNDVLVSGLTSLDSESFHVSVYGSTRVHFQNTTIVAPWDSPNTDGIHIQMSSFVSVAGAEISTGDDCVSMGEGASNVWIERVSCGPGHGISIGSLGSEPAMAGVENVTVTGSVFTGTQNGLRIKTWGNPYEGFVNGVTFEHATMKGVHNPILIDQNYCPGKIDCPGQSSMIEISEVSYIDIHGSSATPVGLKFDCSPAVPCSGIDLQNINLTYQESQPAKAYCKHARGSGSGFVSPNCFPN